MHESPRRPLLRAVSPTRFAAFLAAADGDEDRALALYVWDRDIAAAMLADIAIAEVALRNTVASRLTDAFGREWYLNTDLLLDDRGAKQIANAWGAVTPATRRTPDKLVAQLMFGFWVNLFDKGLTRGDGPWKTKTNNEGLWRDHLAAAFRGRNAEARAAGEQASRAWFHSLLVEVNAVRNRAAHHEPFLNGVPLPGQQRRISAQRAHECTRSLLRCVDRDLDAWVAQDSKVPALFARRP